MKLIKYTLDDFSRGFCANTADDAMKSGATPNAYNVEALRGSLKTMNGCSQYASGELIHNGEKYMPTDLMVFYSSSTSSFHNDDILVAVATTGSINAMFAYKNNAWQILQGNMSQAQTGFVNYYNNGNNMLICNELDGMYRMDSSGMEYIEELTPLVSRMALHYERVWGVGDPDKPNTVYYSAYGSPEIWSGEDTGELSITTYDGDRFVNVATVFDDVLLYRQKSIFRISGTSPENYSLKQIESPTGACGPNAAASNGKYSFFVGEDGIYQYDGTSAQKICNDVLNLFFNERVNKSRLYFCCAALNDNKLFVSLAADDSQNNNCILEYDLTAKVVNLRKGICAINFVIFGGKVYFTNENACICVLGDSEKYGTANIQAHYETPWTDFDGKNTLKALDAVYFSAKGTGLLAVTAITDRGSATYRIQLESADEMRLYRLNMYSEGRRWKFAFDNVDGSSFEICDPEFVLEDEGED